MFRSKKYGRGPVAWQKGNSDRKRPGARPIGGKGIDPQRPQSLPQGIDLGGRPDLRGVFAVLGELGTTQRRIAFSGQLCDVEIQRSRGGTHYRGRFSQQPIQPIGAGARAEAALELAADRDAGAGQVRRPLSRNDRADLSVGELLRSSHLPEVTVSYGKHAMALPWNIATLTARFTENISKYNELNYHELGEEIPWNN